MKFNGLMDAKLKEYKVTDFKGIFAENGSKKTAGFLRRADNIWIQNGALCSRPGLVADTGCIADNLGWSGGFDYSYYATEAEVFADGENRKILAEGFFYDDSVYFCLIHFVHPDGSCTPGSELAFYRTSDSVFYVPDNILFFNGHSTAGSGLFALVHLVNSENPDAAESRVYECSADLDEWTPVTSFYIPTVYLNGRGDRYETAKAANQAFEERPRKLEELNILNGDFYAYFSSDGYSSSFRLPFSNLANKTINCRIYYSLTGYCDWSIPSGQTTNQQTFYGQAVTMHADRTKGVVYFTVSAGKYEIPLTAAYTANNIRIKASKATAMTLGDIAKCRFTVRVGQNLVFAGGNSVFCAKADRPLYIPVDSAFSVGEEGAPLTALGKIKENLVAFKENDIYNMKVIPGAAINSESLLADNDAVFYTSGRISCVQLSATLGLQDKNSLVCHRNRLFFRGNDGAYYSMRASSLFPVCISGPAETYLEEETAQTEPTFAAGFGDHLIFVTGHRALVVRVPETDLKPSAQGIYIWSFPESYNIKAAFTLLGKPCFFGVNSVGGLGYFLHFSGKEDAWLTGGVYDAVQNSRAVKASFTTDEYSLGSQSSLKNVYRVQVRLQAEKVQIALNGRWVAEYQNSRQENEFKTVDLDCGICEVRGMSLSFQSEKPFSLAAANFRFLELS